MVTHPCINRAHDCLTSVIKCNMFPPCYVSPQLSTHTHTHTYIYIYIYILYIYIYIYIYIDGLFICVSVFFPQCLRFCFTDHFNLKTNSSVSFLNSLTQRTDKWFQGDDEGVITASHCSAVLSRPSASHIDLIL